LLGNAANGIAADAARKPEEFSMLNHMAELVRALRRELRMTQEEFAHGLGITVGTVNRWENGRFKPSKLARATLVEFAQKHGISLDRITTQSTDGGAPPVSQN